MKKIILTCIFITYLSSICNAQEKLDIDISKSSIKWIGEYIFSFSGHNGFINFKKGHFIKTGDVITGGEFIIDMNSITNTDIKTKKANEGLVNHLKDPDFFDVKKHPSAKLTIFKVEYFDNNQVRINAKLTIKGITNPIKFNANLDYAKKSLKTKFKINRKKWNVNYQSKMKDSPISDAIGFEVTLNL